MQDGFSYFHSNPQIVGWRCITSTVIVGIKAPESLCYLLMYGVNASIVSKLQHVQNTAAKLVTRKKKYEHITPTLVALHWLPFKFRY
jgi:hypothetical protein